jgi:uncharacterized protein involved in exopolysaccharide biosynthesis
VFGQRPLTLRDLPHRIKERKGLIGGWCALVAAATLAALVWLPRTYQSEAKLFIRLGRESVTLDPTATTSPTVPVFESRESQINSTRDLLTSRSLYEYVVDKLGADTILKGPQAARPSRLRQFVARVKQLCPRIRLTREISPKERAVDALSQSIKVSGARNSNVLSVACQAKDPQLARQLMETFLEAYQHQHWAANRTAGSFDFFAAQTTQLKQQLDYANSRLRDAKNEASLVSIPVEQQALQTQLTQVESARMDAAAMLAASQAMIACLSRAIEVLPEQVVMQSTKGFPNQAADSMRQEFFKLQISNRELESRLGANHPLVRTALAQTDELEKILKAESSDRTQTTLGLNTSRQTLDLELRREEAKLASVHAKIAALDEQYARLRERVKKLNEHEVLIADLQREVNLAAAKYQSYADQLEQARIGEALENFRISNVNVVQPPSLVERPISPDPLVIVGLGAIVAFCGSMGLAIGLKTVEEVGLPATDVPAPANGALPIRNQRAHHANHGVSSGRRAASLEP